MERVKLLGEVSLVNERGERVLIATNIPLPFKFDGITVTLLSGRE